MISVSSSGLVAALDVEEVPSTAPGDHLLERVLRPPRRRRRRRAGRWSPSSRPTPRRPRRTARRRWRRRARRCHEQAGPATVGAVDLAVAVLAPRTPARTRRRPASAAAVNTTTPPAASAASRARALAGSAERRRACRPRSPGRSREPPASSRSSPARSTYVEVKPSVVDHARARAARPLDPGAAACTAASMRPTSAASGAPPGSLGSSARRRRCPSGPAACTSSRSAPRRWRWRCRARPRRRRWPPRRRRPARSGSGAGRRRGRRTAQPAAAGPRAAPARRRTTGTSRIMPSTATMAVAAIENSPPRPGDGAVGRARRCRRRAGPGRARAATQRGRRSPRRPASTATTSWREASQAGTTAARNALSSPKAGDAGQVQPRHVERPEVVVGTRCTSGAGPAGADAEHHADDRRRPAPSTTPLPMTTRRACAGVPPVAAISARLRCCLRALTANAGPASSTTSISAITTISTRTARIVASSVLGPRSAIDAHVGRVGDHRARRDRRRRSR